MAGLWKTFMRLFGWSPSSQTGENNSNGSSSPQLTADIEHNMQHILGVLGHSSDLTKKELRVAVAPDTKLKLLYIEGMSKVDPLLQSLAMDGSADCPPQMLPGQNVLDYLQQTIIPAGKMEKTNDFEKLIDKLLSGGAVILADGEAQALTVGLSEGERRGVEEPTTQSVIRGPREGFTERINVNTALVRHKIKHSGLRLETMQIGRLTKTDVAIMYMQGIAIEKVLKEVRSRLSAIKIDSILESGYIEELIQETTFTPFPTMYNTERPDTAAAGILEGRIAIFVDGTPFVLLVPALFIQFFQSAEDYYQRADFAILLRILRFICFYIALLAPSLYIAVTTYHPELLPTPLLIGLAAQREGVPFPIFVEALAMEITFEILREATVRMPKTLGQSVSIVGTLVIGQSAVQAGLVSPAMVIIVAITAIANFVIPAFNMAISLRMLRFPMMALAATSGLYGIVIGLIALVVHLCSLRSFGVSYMSPVAPFVTSDNKDTLIRLPWNTLFSRPKSTTERNIERKSLPQSQQPMQSQTGDRRESQP